MEEYGKEVPRLSGKVAVVTGGASGIGLAVVTLFSQEGASVLAVDLDMAVLQQALEPLAGNVLPFVADVTREPEVVKGMAEAATRFGSIDVLVPNAGIFGKHAPIEECPH
jgi:NAD(P)-dependent dehydrogenase (short-subunit alcohol dehydrogenase family)